jgi:hypothetical protein
MNKTEHGTKSRENKCLVVNCKDRDSRLGGATAYPAPYTAFFPQLSNLLM